MTKIRRIFGEAGRFFINTFLKSTLGFVILLIVVSILIYYPLASQNITTWVDEGGYMFMGKKILDGAIPYRDYFDHKPPGIYYLCAMTFLILGKSTMAVRLTSLMFNIGTAVVIYFIGKSMKKVAVGQLASVLFLFSSLTPIYFGFLGLAELPMTFFASASILFYMRSKHGTDKRLVLLSGIFLGMATLFKQTAFLIVVAFFIYFALGIRVNEKRNLKYVKSRLLNSVALSIGVGLAWLPFVLYFIINNAFGDMVYAVFAFNEGYAGYYGFTMTNVNTIFTTFGNFEFVSLLAVIGALIVFYRFIFRSHYGYFLLITLTATSLLGQLTIRQYTHYFVTFFPFISLLASFVIIDAIKYIFSKSQYKFSESQSSNVIERKRHSKADSVMAVKAVMTFFLVYLLLSSMGNIIDSYPSKDKYYPWHSDTGMTQMESYIVAHTSHGEKIFIFGSAPYYYLRMDRDPPSKYFYINLWVSSAEIGQDIIKGLEKYHVKYVVVLISWYTFFPNGTPRITRALYSYIILNYETVCTLNAGDAGVSQIYLRHSSFDKV